MLQVLSGVWTKDGTLDEVGLNSERCCLLQAAAGSGSVESCLLVHATHFTSPKFSSPVVNPPGPNGKKTLWGFVFSVAVSPRPRIRLSLSPDFTNWPSARQRFDSAALRLLLQRSLPLFFFFLLPSLSAARLHVCLLSEGFRLPRVL